MPTTINLSLIGCSRNGPDPAAFRHPHAPWMLYANVDEYIVMQLLAQRGSPPLPITNPSHYYAYCLLILT
jgi:hypothetical protein